MKPILIMRLIIGAAMMVLSLYFFHEKNRNAAFATLLLARSHFVIGSLESRLAPARRR